MLLRNNGMLIIIPYHVFGRLAVLKNKQVWFFICLAIMEFAGITCFIAHIRHPKADKSVEIYVVYHKPAPLVKNEVLIPIRAGKALKTEAGEAITDEMIGDDTGFHISDKNDRYSELTVLYWIWKNSKADIVGLMHYRRFLELNPEGKPLPAGDNPMDYFHGLQKDNILKYMQEYDVIVPEKWGTNVGNNLYEHYKASHYIEDLYIVMRYIKHKYPEMNETLEEHVKQGRWTGTNLFIAKKEVIDQYCAWLFDILFSVDEDLSVDHSLFDTEIRFNGVTSEYQRRAPGFLAERLFSVWLDYYSDKYKIKRVPMVFFEPEGT